ncbi:trace amine-associated receptor 1-like [Rhopilema esculentum]|uniref:trace amine-associated receptor 1-like n=1 Tax=Rhopilema esculentum TaxID=499914 RepID=UPI0031E4104A|eukprot:gene17577-9211_t
MGVIYSFGEDIAILLVSLAVIVTNSFEIKILLARRKHFVPYEQLLLSLSVADLLVGASWLLVTVIDLTASSVLSLAVEKNISIPYWCSILLSMTHVYMLTADRFVAVLFPLRHKIHVTNRFATVLILFAWFSSAGVTASLVITISLVGVKYYLADFAFSTLSGMILVYTFIIYKVVIRQKNAANGAVNHASQRQARERRLVYVCLTVTVSFCICTTPLMYTKENNMYQTFFVVDLALILNSLFNPFIYYFWKLIEKHYN